MRACTCTCIRVLQSTTPSFASTLLATGRAAAQAEELANLRQQTSTFTSDVRLNNIRLGAEGDAAAKMGMLQFASTLHATHQQQVAAGGKDAEGAAANVKPFDTMAAMSAMSGAAAGSESGPARLGYGGEQGAQAWAREEKEKRKEKKRKKKAKKDKRKAKKNAKISELLEKGMSYEHAANTIQFLDSSESDSDSSSS